MEPLPMQNLVLTVVNITAQLTFQSCLLMMRLRLEGFFFFRVKYINIEMHKSYIYSLDT